MDNILDQLYAGKLSPFEVPRSPDQEYESAEDRFTLAWEVGSVEPYTDSLLAGFDTYPWAVLDVIFGRFSPTGKMPITLPRDDSVLAVNAEGVCISPNDVPGYDKDKYMPEDMKDENGKAYAYRDSAGNYYELNFGLHY